MSQDDSWDVRVEGETVVVELPAEVELDEDTGGQINEEFAVATKKSQTKYQLTLLEIDNPLSSVLFDEVKKGGKSQSNRLSIIAELSYKAAMKLD